MLPQEAKKKKYRSVHAFTNVSGASLILETYSYGNISHFMLRRVNCASALKRSLCFLSLLVIYAIAVKFGLIDGWCFCPVILLGVIGMWGMINEVVQGKI